MLESDDVFVGDKTIERLLAGLDDYFPHYNPTPDDSLATVMYRAGQRSVVDFIRLQIED